MQDVLAVDIERNLRFGDGHIAPGNHSGDASHEEIAVFAKMKKLLGFRLAKMRQPENQVRCFNVGRICLLRPPAREEDRPFGLFGVEFKQEITPETTGGIIRC